MMNREPGPPSSSGTDRDEAHERIYEQLDGVIRALKAAKKILARDWAQLTPRERSAQSRVVKELEEQQRALEDEIAMLR